jgi:hypothetical protein
MALDPSRSVKIDLRSAATVVAMFAPFESVTLLWASATLHLAPGDAATVGCAWLPNTLNVNTVNIEKAFDGCEMSTAKYSGMTAVVPLTQPTFGRELKALVVGNPAPCFVADATSAAGFIKVKILFSGSGVAAI